MPANRQPLKRCRAVTENKPAAEYAIASDSSLAGSAAAETLLSLMSVVPSSSLGFDEDTLATTSANKEGHANMDGNTVSMCRDADSQKTKQSALVTSGSTQVYLNIINIT